MKRLRTGVLLSMDIKEQGSLFPIRFFGFGFFWAWLFLAGVSPSPLIGAPICFAGLPYEMVELSLRALFLVLVLLLVHPLATAAGQKYLLIIGVLSSAVAVPLLLTFGTSPAIASATATLVAAGEVCMFLLWLCFFGYMKLGETFALLVGSYAIGSGLFLLTIALGFNAMATAAVLFPLLSGGTFVLSKRLSVVRTGEDLFAADGSGSENQCEDVAGEVLFGSVNGPKKHKTSFILRGGADVGAAQQLRINAALILYSFTFSLSCGVVLLVEEHSVAIFTVEPVSMIVLGLAFVVFIKTSSHPDRPYGLYRAVAPLIGTGFVFMTVGSLPLAVGAFFVSLGYVLFELLVLNDCCNFVKANDASLLKIMALARLAITLGMFAGWAAVFIAVSFGIAQVSILAVIGLFVVLIAVSLIFNERDFATFVSVADDRALSEHTAKGPSREELMSNFVEQYGLSRRESEVAAYLLAGRTTTFAAEKMFIAESTVRAHVHSIYRKCGAHSRMELMDMFDEYWLQKEQDS